MKYRGVHLHGAYLDTAGCLGMLRLLETPEVARLLAALIGGYARSPYELNQASAQDLEAFLADARDARARLKRHQTELDGSDEPESEPVVHARSGTAEPVATPSGAGSVTSQPGLVVVGLVAERFGWSESYVTRICRGEIPGRHLSAIKPKGKWLIRLESVEELEASLGSVA